MSDETFGGYKKHIPGPTVTEERFRDGYRRRYEFVGNFDGVCPAESGLVYRSNMKGDGGYFLRPLTAWMPPDDETAEGIEARRIGNIVRGGV